MANSARIDELKKKFDENPRRYFAPLANEYRKAGDADQAIAICREFLPQQPGHMSGHIVYGQALFDSQQYDEARTVFDTALSLDPENLIALRQLGDIARSTGDHAAASGWYQRVLEADPRNVEISAILTELAAARPAQPTAVPESASVPPTEPVPALDITPEPVSQPDSQTAPTVEIQAVAAPPVIEAAPVIEASPEPLVFVEPEELPGASVPAPQPAPEPVHTEPAAQAQPEDDGLLDFDGLGLEPESPVTPRISTPRASLQAMGIEVERAEDDMFSLPEPATSAHGEPRAAEDAPAQSDPFATETMAELYLSQGHRADALRVYRQLLAARPGDAGLQARVSELESDVPPGSGPSAEAHPPVELVASAEPSPEPVPELAPEPAPEPVPQPVAAGPSIRDFLAGLAARTAGARDLAPEAAPVVAATPEPVLAATPEPAPAAMPTPVQVVPIFSEAPAPEPGAGVQHGGSIDALFGAAGVAMDDQDAAATLADAFAAQPDAEPTPAPTQTISGAPARRATEELSLDTVFREPASEPSAQADSFSFDRFFAGGSPTPGATPTPTAPHSQEPGSDDDIEQFNSWLDGLKKR